MFMSPILYVSSLYQQVGVAPKKSTKILVGLPERHRPASDAQLDIFEMLNIIFFI